MWRVFHWLNGYAPSFHKFTLMLAGLAAVVATSLLLGQIDPIIGIVFGFGTVFALWYGSIDYRFNRKSKIALSSAQPPVHASEDQARTRARRHAKTEFWRRMILAKVSKDGSDGAAARAIVDRWRAADEKAAKARLRRALGRLSLDESQRAMAERGIGRMPAAQALQCACDLEEALDELPRATEALRRALDAADAENDKPRS